MHGYKTLPPPVSQKHFGSGSFQRKKNPFEVLLNDERSLWKLASVIGSSSHKWQSAWGWPSTWEEQSMAARFALLDLPQIIAKIESARIWQDVPRVYVERLSFILDNLLLAYRKDGMNKENVLAMQQVMRELHGRLYETGKLLSLFNTGLKGFKLERKELEAKLSDDPNWLLEQLPGLMNQHSRNRKNGAKWKVRMLGAAAADLFVLEKAGRKLFYEKHLRQ